MTYLNFQNIEKKKIQEPKSKGDFIKMLMKECKTKVCFNKHQGMIAMIDNI